MNTLDYSCKFCGKTFQNKQALAGHQTFCKCNPNYSKNKNKAIHTNSLKFQKIQYEITCPKCGKIHVETMTKACFEKGKYKKYCSRTCANSRGISIKRNEKIKQSLLNCKSIIETCVNCGNLFEKSLLAHNKKLCNICLNKIRYKNSTYFIDNKNQIRCKFCGSLKQSNECLSICRRKKFIENFLIKSFNFDKTVIGNKIKVLNELNKIQKQLYKDYYVDELSLNEISKKYNFKGFGNITTLFKMFDFKIRDLKTAGFLSYKNGKNGNQESFNRFKSGYHTSWNGQKFFLRSSYEFDFANELDKNKIEYEVETLRIEYFDTQKNRMRIAIPDFYLPVTNEIIEIKSEWTYNKQNIIDKFKEYVSLGYKPKLILEHKEEKISF